MHKLLEGRVSNVTIHVSKENYHITLCMVSLVKLTKVFKKDNTRADIMTLVMEVPEMLC